MKMKVGKLFNATGYIVALGVCVLSFCAASISNADVCTDPQTAVEYDSTDNVEPQDTSDWSLTCIDILGVDFGTISNGVLIVDDTSTSTKAKYCAADLFEDTCKPRPDAVYEFSCKAISVADNANVWSEQASFVFGCGFATGDGTDAADDFDLRVAVTLNEGVGFWELDGDGKAKWLDVGGIDQHIDISQIGEPPFSWTQAHVFRVVKDGALVKMYVDNNSTPSLSFRLAELADNFLEDEAWLAATSIPGRSEFELYHFRYRIGSTNFNTITPGSCAGDIDEDDDVDTDDLIALLAAWGPCTNCDEDLDNDDNVGTSDLLILLSNWGDCP